MNLKERDDRIFCKYRKLGKQIVVRDGAISEEYEKARRKLLVIIKEPNAPDGKWKESGGDLRGYGN
jgi:hypothetical protein